MTAAQTARLVAAALEHERRNYHACGCRVCECVRRIAAEAAQREEP